MAKIRHDLEGVVYAFRANGETVVLKAGQDIPEDISLGSHLVAADQAEAKPEPVVTEAPKRRGRPAKATAVQNAASE